MRDLKRAFGAPDEEFSMRVQQTLLAIEEKEEQPVRKKMTLSLAFACILCVTLLAAAAFAASNMLGGRPDETQTPLAQGSTDAPDATPTPMPRATLPDATAPDATATVPPLAQWSTDPTPMPFNDDTLTFAPNTLVMAEEGQYGTFHQDPECGDIGEGFLPMPLTEAFSLDKKPCRACCDGHLSGWVTMVDEDGRAIYMRALDVYGADWRSIIQAETVVVAFSGDGDREHYHASDSCEALGEYTEVMVRMTGLEAFALGYQPCQVCVARETWFGGTVARPSFLGLRLGTSMDESLGILEAAKGYADADAMIAEYEAGQTITRYQWPGAVWGGEPCAVRAYFAEGRALGLSLVFERESGDETLPALIRSLYAELSEVYGKSAALTIPDEWPSMALKDMWLAEWWYLDGPRVSLVYQVRKDGMVQVEARVGSAEATTAAMPMAQPTITPMPMAEPTPTPMPTETPIDFWHTQNGAFYHADKTCSGMKDALPISAADAQALGKDPCPVCVEQSTGPEADGTRPTISVAAHLTDCTPHSVIVRAYDPNGRMSGIVNFDAEPLDDTPGGLNETSYLAVASKVFNRLKLTPCIGDEAPEESLWRFSIDYTVMDDAEVFHTLRLDFYDYSNLVGYTRLDLPGDAGRTVYVTMPLEDSFVFEDIYLNVVCRLKRLPTARQN